MAAWTELPPTGGLPECAALVQLAERLRWSAAELVIQYARRALAESAAEGGPLAVRAQALMAAALVRLGRHADAVEPALAALHDADQAGVPELIPAIRLDLAACAHGLGESLLGCTILRPVLENAGARPSTRAIAITALVGCTAHVGRRDDLEDSLAEAERLLAADDALNPDARRMERAQLAMRTAAYYRRYGETEDAVDAARNGLGLLTKLRDPRLEGGLARAGLTFELVCALLDDGELGEAERAADPLLAEPVRSASAAAIGRLMLAMVTRVHVPAGRVDLGRSLLGHVTWIAERHEHDWLLADAHLMLAQLDEAAGSPVDALQALRASRVAEQRQVRRVDAARRQLMIEFGARPMPLETVNSLLRTVVRAQVSAAPAVSAPAVLPPARPPASQTPKKPEPAETDEATGLLTRAGLSQRLQAVRSANRPVALTLVRLDPVDGEGRSGTTRDASASDPAPEALATLAGRVRDIAPEDAELARSDGSELAVLLPHTTRDEAEEFAATIRESAIESDWLTEASISTGVAHSGPATDDDADSLLSAARETFTTAEAERPGPTVPEAPSSEDLFLSTLEAAAGDPGAGYQEIRALLAPLLGHPSLKRTDPPPPAPDPVPASTRADSEPSPDRLAEQEVGSDPTWAGGIWAGGSSSAPADEAGSAEPGSDSGSAYPGGGRVSEPEAGVEADSVDPAGGWSGESRPEAGLGVGPGSVDAAGGWVGEPRSGAGRAVEAESVGGSASVGESQLGVSRGFGAGPGGSEWAGESRMVPSGDFGVGSVNSGSAWAGESRAGVDPAGEARAEGSRASVSSGSAWGDESRSASSGDSGSVWTGGLSARRQVVPGESEEEGDIPEPPGKPDIIAPKDPDPFPVKPEEPDAIPPVSPGPQPTPEVPGPAEIPAVPERGVPGPAEPAEERPEPRELEELLGPVQGPKPRPDDGPPKPFKRPERSEAASIAELLTEALVAYQETAPEEDPPTQPVLEPVTRHETRPHGRHRMPDWDSGV